VMLLSISRCNIVSTSGATFSLSSLSEQRWRIVFPSYSNGQTS
jgi:hypothetical protein